MLYIIDSYSALFLRKQQRHLNHICIFRI